MTLSTDTNPIQSGEPDKAAKTLFGQPLAGLFHLLVIYVVWGSTYLAIRVAVRDGAGWPPFFMGASRVLVAGLLLLGYAKLRRRPLLPSRRDLITLAISGTIMWVGANGLVNWAEMRVESGLAALIVGSMPMWTALQEAVLNRKVPTIRLIVSLLVGFSGLVLLSLHTIHGDVPGDIWAIIALILSPNLWIAGSLLQSRRPVKLGPAASSGWQQLLASISYFAIAFLIHEPLPAPIPEAWVAWGYLVVFGSLFAFTSLIQALRLLPTTIIMTYAYVNPVIAVILGYLILRESVTIWTVMGMVLVIVGVLGVFREKKK
ncbi:MAG: EamA family transporter [Planctomycetota bacterium]